MRSIASGKRLLLAASLLCLHRPATAQHREDGGPAKIIESPQQAELNALLVTLKAGSLDLSGMAPATAPAGIFPGFEFSSAFDPAAPSLAGATWQRNITSPLQAHESGATGAQRFHAVAVATPAGRLSLDVYVVRDTFYLDVPGLPRYEYHNTALACYEAGTAQPLAVVRYISRRADFLASDAKWMQLPAGWQAKARSAAIVPAEDGFALFPNPAAKEVSLQFALSEAGEVGVRVYNAMGQLVDAPLSRAMMPAGPQRYRYDITRLPAGIYTIKAIVRHSSFTVSLTTL